MVARHARIGAGCASSSVAPDELSVLCTATLEHDKTKLHLTFGKAAGEQLLNSEGWLVAKMLAEHAMCRRDEARIRHSRRQPSADLVQPRSDRLRAVQQCKVENRKEAGGRPCGERSDVERPCVASALQGVGEAGQRAVQLVGGSRRHGVPAAGRV